MEQSHKAEMGNALRGDFARLRERGVATTFAPTERPAAPILRLAPVEVEAPPADMAPASWLARFLSAR